MTVPKPRALLSVSNKAGIEDLGRSLVERGWEVLSTGGTARALRAAAVPVTDVADVTGHPEMMDGRVKTLHPAIHAGLLARRDRIEDTDALERHGYAPIDLVAVNLYPFRETVAEGGVPVAEAMEKVDIGGPTMIRAAAKNHRDVWVIVDPNDYDRVIQAIDDGRAELEGEPLRRELAAKVFEHISAYDQAIANYLIASDGEDFPRNSGAIGAPAFELRASLESTLRYGENPDQRGSFYSAGGAGGSTGVAALEQHHGKALSYNNLLDLDGALLCLSPFAFSDRAACVVIKHTTPAGLAIGEELTSAYQRAVRTDPVSSFGSVVAVNRLVDEPTAEAMSTLFIECIVAPAFSDGAYSILSRKKNIRLLTFGSIESPSEVDPSDDPTWSSRSEEERRWCLFLAAHGRLPRAEAFRSVYGGVLVQDPPNPPYFGLDRESWTVATERSPDAKEADDLRFAWAAVFGVKSNAILLARDGATLGIGAGQMSRVDSSRIAVMKASDADLDLNGAVLASDAFFPFRDGVDAAADAGIRAIIQPGGSVRDDEVIAAADEHGIAMVLTGRRLFRH